MRALALVSSGTAACAPSREPRAVEPTEARPSPPAVDIESVCASANPQSELPCRSGTYCKRSPIGDSAGVHCGCVAKRTKCQPLLARVPDGACTKPGHESVLVEEGSVAEGWDCICPTGPAAKWVCTPPSPGGPLVPPDLPS